MRQAAVGKGLPFIVSVKQGGRESLAQDFHNMPLYNIFL